MMLVCFRKWHEYALSIAMKMNATMSADGRDKDDAVAVTDAAATC